jgi:hypothetical protein
MEILALELDAFDARIPGEEVAFEHRGLSAPEDWITRAVATPDTVLESVARKRSLASLRVRVRCRSNSRIATLAAPENRRSPGKLMQRVPMPRFA